MAKAVRGLAGGEGGSAATVYRRLLEAEEAAFTERGGRRILVRDGVKFTEKPSPLLAALRRGEPVTVPDFKLSWDERGGRVSGRYVEVHAGGLLRWVESR